MPPHCDSLDGPVVNAARTALDLDDVELVLPYVPAEAEAEVRSSYDSVKGVRKLAPEARDLADRLFFETVVRLHRAGEGAPYTGLKPAGLSFGPVIPLAESAIETGSAEPVSRFLTRELEEELERRLNEVSHLKTQQDRSLHDKRRYVEAMLGFQVFSHHLFQAIHAHALHHEHA